MRFKDEEFEKELEMNISVFDKITLSDEKKREIAANILNSQHTPRNKKVPFYATSSFKRTVSAAACFLIALTAAMAFVLPGGLNTKEAVEKDYSAYLNGDINSLTDSTVITNDSTVSSDINDNIGSSSEYKEEQSMCEEISEEYCDKSEEENVPECNEDYTASDTLYAVEINDNHSYSIFASVCGIFSDSLPLNIYPYNRVEVYVASSGMPAGNVTVYGLDAGGNKIAEARTDINGNAYLYGGLFEAGGAVIVTANACGIDASVKNGKAEIETKTNVTKPSSANIMFIFDTSVYMEDELDYFKSRLNGIIDGVASDTDTEIKFSVNFCYNDGELMISSNSFTSDNSETVSILRSSQIIGSAPEAIDKILINAVCGHEWDDDATKICVLILGNPINIESDACASIKIAVEEAQKLGVRIIPVVPNDTNTAESCFYRSLAAATGGTTAFITENLTNESGSTGDTLKAEELDSLLIRVISSYLKRDTDGDVN
ncbi:MAG: hypothetical protein PHW77_00385 [Eubacteriales bacterium]|nr:hypothetical protein [Eubacteriales bacterium]